MHASPRTPSEGAIDIGAARQALAVAAGRSAELITTLDPGLAVPRSEWTVGGTAAHLIIALRAFTGSVTGDDRQWRAWEDAIPEVRATERVALVNRVMIAAEPGRSASESAQAITDCADAFLAATAGLPPGTAVPTPWYGRGSTLTVAEATCLLLGEQLVHGRDVAGAAGRKWPIAKQDALLVFEAVRGMMPRMADPDALGDLSAGFELHLGRAARFVVRFAAGTATVEPGRQRVDCHVLGDPVTLLLIGYGRITQWQAIGRAKLITWGRKPWLAFRFPSFFSHP